MQTNFYKSIVLLVCLAIANKLNAGTDFAAIATPESIQNELKSVQTYVSKNLKKGFTLDFTPPQNLHITLKEIADLSAKELISVNVILNATAEESKPSNISDALNNGHLKIRSDGLVKLQLKSNKWLTGLALKIDKKLKKLKKDSLLKNLEKRMDFPDNGHISLGYIKYQNKPIDKKNIPKKMFNNIEQNFKNKPKVNFDVDHFILLKSNSPKTPRIYTNNGTFYLKAPKLSEIGADKETLKILTQKLSNLSFRHQSLLR